MAVTDELGKLAEMRRAGTLTEAEYEAAKAKVLTPARSEHGVVRGFFAAGAAFSLVFWILLAAIFLGAFGALEFFGDDMAPETRLMVLAPILCIGALGAACSWLDGPDFASPGLLLGGAAVVGIGGVLLVLSLPLLIAVMVIAAIGAAITWFGDLFPF